ncbi:hypothetical protein BLOT_010844 [Blomia tropicalis]|nr:hypothetical protein BLOT_010844 [Blomia tropicalis]
MLPPNSSNNNKTFDITPKYTSRHGTQIQYQTELSQRKSLYLVKVVKDDDLDRRFEKLIQNK